MSSPEPVQPMLPAPPELVARAAELLRTWRVLDTIVTVDWNARLTTTAGRAFVRRGHVELNPTLLARAPDQIQVVLTHEVAHVAAFRLFGPNIPAHGRHWRALMRLAGLPPDVTHRIPLDGDARAAVAFAAGGQPLVAQPRPRARRRRFLYLRVCERCGERMLQRAVRYGRCHGCDGRDAFRVFRAPASAAGRAALLQLAARTGPS